MKGDDMAAITKTRLQEACETATAKLKQEMGDTQWAAATETLCKLYTKYLFNVLEAKE
jgi:hypothetical protein